MRQIPEQFERYLRLIGIKNISLGFKGLEEIVLKHLCAVPFENVSKLLLFGSEGKGRPFTFSEFLDGIEYHDFGGTCHSNNPFLADLLKALGYEAYLLGADMDEPNVHTCIRVKLGFFEYHVDVGYAAPFRKPMRLDYTPYEIKQGDYRYLFDRYGKSSVYEVSIVSGKERLHGYVAHGPPRNAEFFKKTITESFEPGKTFMSYLRITRFFERHAVELKNRMLFFHKDGQSRQKELQHMEDVEQAVQNDLAMPRCPVEKAIEVLEHVTGEPFFEGPICPERL
jgi:arylamine N-acetyltransferase